MLTRFVSHLGHRVCAVLLVPPYEARSMQGRHSIVLDWKYCSTVFCSQDAEQGDALLLLPWQDRHETSKIARRVMA